MSEATLHTTTATALLPGRYRQSLLQKRWFYHPLFWILYYGLTIVLYLSLRDTLTVSSYVMAASMVTVQAAFSYLHLYYLIPRLLFTRRYFYYALALAAILALCPLIVLALEQVYMLTIEHRDPAKVRLFTIGNWVLGMIQFIYILGLISGIKFVRDTILNQQRQKEREKHYLETELKFLRSQIQPHFFFNTLNNLYSLTLKKSDLAPEVVLKLSQLMSYMLYESTAPLVPLAKEIDYLHNYLDVEQLRFGPRLTVDFTIEGPIAGVDIPPMILILFLENSFKHGVKNTISDILLTIRLKVADGRLFFQVENPIAEEEPFPGAKHDAAPNIPPGAPNDNKGIGLTNARRRLELLYGDNYTLDIRNTSTTFIISLTIPL